MSSRSSEVSGVVYGVRIRGILPAGFEPYLLPSRSQGPELDEFLGPLDVTYETGEPLPEVDEIWESEPGGPGTPGRLTVSRVPEGFDLTVCGPEPGRFRGTARRIDVRWTAESPEAAHSFFAYALPLWLETRGIPVLHGSAVALGGRAVGFVGPSGVGKSVLCAELLHLGCGFVTDDGLALGRRAAGEWQCFQGPPLLRLWPSGLAGRLQLAPESLERVVEVSDKRRVPLARLSPREPSDPSWSRPLAAVYVLDRRPASEGPVEPSPCRPREALVRLLEHGVAAAPAAALGLAGERFDVLADLARTIPVRRLSIPSGADSAARALDVIERDLSVAI